MADQLQLRGGTTAQTATFTGALREVTVDTDKDTLVVHDNALAGGYPLLRQDLSNLPAGTIDNADINASAAIVDTKLDTIATAGKVSNSATTATDANTASAIVARDASGNFTAGTITAALTGAASSNVLKAGDTMTGALVVPLASAATPSLTFTGDLNTGIFSPGADTLAITTAGTNRLHITSAGLVGIGVSAPSNPIHVTNSSSSVATAYFNNTSTGGDSPSLIVQGGANNAGTVGTFEVRDYSGNTDFKVQGDGKVGINTTAPLRALQIGAHGSGDGEMALASSTTGNCSILMGDGATGSDFYRGYIQYQNINDALVFATATTQRMAIDSSGRLLVGTSSATAVTDGNVSAQFEVEGTTTATSAISIIRNSNDTNAGGLIIAKSRGTAAGSNTLVGDGDSLGFIQFQGADGTQKRIGAIIAATADAATGSNDLPTRLTFSTTAAGASSPTERMRIDSGGVWYLNTTSNTLPTGNGVVWTAGELRAGNSSYSGGGAVLELNRQNSDGDLVRFYQASAQEGAISVSGTTVTYGGGHLARWSQLPNSKNPSQLLKGTVMSNLDEMCDWDEEDNEQLNKTKVSDVEGDKNVAGVFVSTSFSDDGPLDFFVAMTGDMVIRIAADTTVERGDLLMSAGDGTAKPQDDDIIRSKTIAKVTSTNVSCTYEDGSYCVPCVLMAC
jgi:hypothetical protein